MALNRLQIVLIVLLALLAGCHDKRPQPVVLFSKAIITREHVDEAMSFEAELSKRYAQPAPEGQPWFQVLPGSACVIIVAGHATSHMRDGQVKSQDGGTGALAFMLHRLADCPAIINTHQSPTDPNSFDDIDFKRELAAMIDRHKPALVLDLHGSSSGRPYDIDFGTIGGTSLLGHRQPLERLAACLRAEGMRNFSQDYFNASAKGRTTRFVSARGVPCVQLEINSSWLPQPKGGPVDLVQRQRMGQLLQGMVRFLKPYAK